MADRTIIVYYVTFEVDDLNSVNAFICSCQYDFQFVLSDPCGSRRDVHIFCIIAYIRMEKSSSFFSIFFTLISNVSTWCFASSYRIRIYSFKSSSDRRVAPDSSSALVTIPSSFLKIILFEFSGIIFVTVA